MRGASELPAGLATREDIDVELRRVLAGHDPFWPRWIVAAPELHLGRKTTAKAKASRTRPPAAKRTTKRPGRSKRSTKKVSRKRSAA